MDRKREQHVRKAAEELKDFSRYYIEAAFSIAQINRAYYEALIEKGFTQKQALELTKFHGASFEKKGGGGSNE